MKDSAFGDSSTGFSRSFWPCISNSTYPGLGVSAICPRTLRIGIFLDRKSVVDGKSVDLGGRRIIQEKDGIRDASVTGVQTCALPISGRVSRTPRIRGWAYPRSAPEH